MKLKLTHDTLPFIYQLDNSVNIRLIPVGFIVGGIVHNPRDKPHELHYIILINLRLHYNVSFDVFIDVPFASLTRVRVSEVQQHNSKEMVFFRIFPGFVCKARCKGNFVAYN